jgi:hypothetical protein
MVDSAIGEDEVENEMVWNEAKRYNADYVVLKDFLFDQERTTRSIRDFMDGVYESGISSFSGRVFFPLQPSKEGRIDHWKHYKELESELSSSSHTHFMLGGLKDAKPEKQIKALRKFRDVAGYEKYLHGLGMGGSLDFVKAIRDNPRLVDSVDLTTPVHAVNNGNVMGKDLKHRNIGIAQGENTTTVGASFVNSMLIHLNYLYSPYCNDDVLDDKDENLEDFIN